MKKYVSYLLIAVMVLLLAACGKSTEEKWQEQYDLGVQYLTEGDYEAAVVAFTAAIDIEPKYIQAYTGLVQSYEGSDDYETAVAVVDIAIDVLKEAEESPEQENLESFISVAIDSYETVVDLDRQYDFWVSISEIGPEDEADSYLQEGALVLTQMGTEYLEQEDYGTAIDAFTKALDLDPRTWEAYEGEISVYEAQEDYAEAVSVIGQGIEAVGYENMDSDTQSWIVDKYISWAEMYAESGDDEEAIRILEEGYQYTANEDILELLDYIRIGNELVVWDDTVLESMLREKLGLEGDVYAKDLDDVTSLLILGNTHIGINGDEDFEWSFRFRQGVNGGAMRLYAYYGIKNTSGNYVEYTERGEIRSIEVLKYFRNLTSVAIIANHIEDISVISEMNLTSALFFANDIADLSPLDGVEGVSDSND